MTIQLFRPADPPEGCHCYGIVIDDGDTAFVFYDSDGNLHEDIGMFNEDTTGHAEWVEMLPRPALERAALAVLDRRGYADPDDRRDVLGADGKRIGAVSLGIADQWLAIYDPSPVLNLQQLRPSRDSAIAWVLEQDRPRIAKQREAGS